MERLAVPGSELVYETVGEGDPIVLIPGVIVGEAFEPLLGEPSLTREFKVISYYRRGNSSSGPIQGPFSIAAQAKDALAIIREVAGGRAHVVGHSYGGAIALQLSIDAPEAVHTLSLLEPPMPVPSTGALFEALPPIVGMYQSGNATGAIDSFLQMVLHDTYRADIDRTLNSGWFDRAVANADTFFQVEVAALGEWQLTEEMVKSIRQPVLSMSGTRSAQAFRDGHALVQQWLPEAEVVEIEGVSHCLQMQKPQAVAEQIAAFLAKHPMRLKTTA